MPGGYEEGNVRLINNLLAPAPGPAAITALLSPQLSSRSEQLTGLRQASLFLS